ncbi:MAG TPA: YciI family protein [Rudaea sp.]
MDDGSMERRSNDHPGDIFLGRTMRSRKDVVPRRACDASLPRDFDEQKYLSFCATLERRNAATPRRVVSFHHSGGTMARFMFVFRLPHDQPPRSPAQLQDTLPKWQAWFKELAEQGHLKDPGNPLERGGKVVRGSGKGVTDGPYVEKDLVMGYMLVEARDLDEACEIASGCPRLATQMVVEVRPIIAFNP